MTNAAMHMYSADVQNVCGMGREEERGRGEERRGEGTEGGMAQEKVGIVSKSSGGDGRRMVNGRKRRLMMETAPHDELTCRYSCATR